MFNPDFNPYDVLQHHEEVLNRLINAHNESVAYKHKQQEIITELVRLNDLIRDISKNQMDVTQLLLQNQNNLKYLREELERIDVRTSE